MMSHASQSISRSGGKKLNDLSISVRMATVKDNSSFQGIIARITRKMFSSSHNGPDVQWISICSRRSCTSPPMASYQPHFLYKSSMRVCTVLSVLEELSGWAMVGVERRGEAGSLENGTSNDTSSGWTV